MSFFSDLTSNLKSVRFTKEGCKLANNGNLDEAAEQFFDGFLLAKDIKTKCENETWYHLCLAIEYNKEGNLEKSMQEYSQFKLVWKSYIDECNSTPGLGTRTRYLVWENEIKDFVIQHQTEIAKFSN